MPVAITQTPSYPTAKAPVRVSFTLSGGGNFVRVWATDAPLGSELRKKLDAAGASRVEVFSGDAADVWTFRADRGGCYVFAAQEYQRGAASGFSGGYAGDSRGVPSETKIGAESSVTVRFGQRLTMPLGAGADTATLVLWAWGDTIRATTTELHGEASPAIVNPGSARATTAASDATVKAKAAALAGVTASAALGTVADLADDIITNVNAHMTQAGVHAVNDEANAVGAAFKSGDSPMGVQQAAAEIVARLRRHMNNDSGGGVGSGGYHTKADTANGLVVPLPGDTAGSIAAMADAWRAYEAHRVSTAVHSAADTTNALAALSPLLDLHRAFLAAIQPSAPTAPATVNAAVTTLVHGAGMREG